MENLISELAKFSDHILEMGNAISDGRVEDFEIRRNLTLPNDFKKFIPPLSVFTSAVVV